MFKAETRRLTHCEYAAMIEWIERNTKGSYKVWYFKWRTVDAIKYDYKDACETFRFLGIGVNMVEFEFVDEMVLFKLRWG